MKLQALLAAATLTLPLSALAEGTSPWLPIPGQVSLSLNHSEQSGKEAYIGDTQLPLSAITSGAASKYQRATTQIRLGYGLSDAVSLDASLGYSKVKVGAADNDSGMTDSVFGANWRVLDEFDRLGLPTLTLRGAVILAGGYDRARLAGLGKGENGIELAAILGKQVTPALGLWAEAGLQNRSGAVPDAQFLEVGARYRIAPRWSANLGYSVKKFGGNLDIGGAGFSPSRFQEVREERNIAKLGLGYALAGNQGLALNLAKVVSGRNTVKDDQIIGVSYTHGF